MKSGEASSQIEDGFTHLEVHSYYTLLEATPSVEELVAQAKAEGSTHLALTDTNALYGAVAFQRACLEAGIQPIEKRIRYQTGPAHINSRRSRFPVCGSFASPSTSSFVTTSTATTNPLR